MSDIGQVRVEGGRNLRRTMNRAGMDLKQMNEVHAKIGGVIAPAARSNTPTFTGRLAGSVRSSGTRTATIIRAGRKSIPYAGVIHYGNPHRGTAAQPFIREAAQSTEPTWFAIYSNAVEKILDKIKGI